MRAIGIGVLVVLALVVSTEALVTHHRGREHVLQPDAGDDSGFEIHGGQFKETHNALSGILDQLKSDASDLEASYAHMQLALRQMSGVLREAASDYQRAASLGSVKGVEVHDLHNVTEVSYLINMIQGICKHPGTKGPSGSGSENEGSTEEQEEDVDASLLSLATSARVARGAIQSLRHRVDAGLHSEQSSGAGFGSSFLSLGSRVARRSQEKAVANTLGGVLGQIDSIAQLVDDTRALRFREHQSEEEAARKEQAADIFEEGSTQELKELADAGGGDEESEESDSDIEAKLAAKAEEDRTEAAEKQLAKEEGEDTEYKVKRHDDSDKYKVSAKPSTGGLWTLSRGAAGSAAQLNDLCRGIHRQSASLHRQIQAYLRARASLDGPLGDFLGGKRMPDGTVLHYFDPEQPDAGSLVVDLDVSADEAKRRAERALEEARALEQIAALLEARQGLQSGGLESAVRAVEHVLGGHLSTDGIVEAAAPTDDEVAAIRAQLLEPYQQLRLGRKPEGASGEDGDADDIAEDAEKEKPDAQFEEKQEEDRKLADEILGAIAAENGEGSGSGEEEAESGSGSGSAEDGAFLSLSSRITPQSTQDARFLQASRQADGDNAQAEDDGASAEASNEQTAEDGSADAAADTEDDSAATEAADGDASEGGPSVDEVLASSDELEQAEALADEVGVPSDDLKKLQSDAKMQEELADSEVVDLAAGADDLPFDQYTMREHASHPFKRLRAATGRPAIPGAHAGVVRPKEIPKLGGQAISLEPVKQTP